MFQVQQATLNRAQILSWSPLLAPVISTSPCLLLGLTACREGVKSQAAVSSQSLHPLRDFILLLFYSQENKTIYRQLIMGHLGA